MDQNNKNNEESSLNLGNKESQKSSSKFRDFINTPIVTLFLGSFIFSSLIENYKDDLSFRRSIVSDLYRPMLETQISCKVGQQNLIFKTKAFSDGFKQILNEIDNLSARNVSSLSSGEEFFLETLLKGNESLNTESKKLREEQDKCQQKLTRYYEEISLSIGAYDKFKSSTKELSNEIKEIDKIRQDIAEENIKYEGLKKLIENVGEFIENDPEFDSESLKIVQNDMMPGFRKISEAIDRLSNLEEKKGLSEARFHERLHEIFANEINYRFKKRFISKIFDIF